MPNCDLAMAGKTYASEKKRKKVCIAKTPSPPRVPSHGSSQSSSKQKILRSPSSFREFSIRLDRRAHQGSTPSRLRRVLRETWATGRFLLTQIWRGTSVVGFSLIILRKLCQIFAFAMLLLPGFLKIVYWYFLSGERTRVTYGNERRQTADIFCSPEFATKEKGERPVVIFISGCVTSKK